jgi:hyperosmotically inducible periplasmic protein
MKMNNAFRKAASMWVVAAMTCVTTRAWSQPGDPGSVGASTPVVAAASSPMTPKASRQANRALQKQIYAAFAKHKEIDAGGISVKANDGAVTINGTVKDPAQIAQVSDIARGVSGVTSVTNRLAVQRPLGQ